MSDCKTYWLHALTPVHAGTGLGSGFIDLPIMREKITGWPLVPASSVKGVQADIFRSRQGRSKDEGRRLPADFGQLAFGQPGDDSGNAGAVVFTDARLVCLATRSYYGTFAYVTCPLALNRLRRDAGTAMSVFAGLPDAALHDGIAAVAHEGCEIAITREAQKQMCLGELNLHCKVSSEAALWAQAIAQVVFPDEPWASIFIRRFVVVPDETFDFLCETGCEVNARIKIEPERKIVQRGHFWYEESLPAESILSGLVWCDRVFRKDAALTPKRILEEICQPTVLQIGGKATVGKGRMRCCYE